MVDITVTPVNDPPSIVAPIEPQLAIEDSPFSLSVAGNFTDVDGDALTYQAFGLPTSGNILFNTQTGAFSGTPRLVDARDNDPYLVQVQASDGGIEVASQEFELTISARDRANVSLNITAAPDPAMVNDQLQWTMTANNAQGPQNAPT